MTAHHDQPACANRGVRWGVRCADDEVLWVDGEGAARQLLASLVGARHLVRAFGPDQES